MFAVTAPAAGYRHEMRYNRILIEFLKDSFPLSLLVKTVVHSAVDSRQLYAVQRTADTGHSDIAGEYSSKRLLSC